MDILEKVGKISASQILSVPDPRDRAYWSEVSVDG